MSTPENPNCDVCESPLSEFGVQANSNVLQRHVSNYNDPHRTMELVRNVIPKVDWSLSAPEITGITSGVYKQGDFYYDAKARQLYACLTRPDGTIGWFLVADVSPERIHDYVTTKDLESYTTYKFVNDRFVSKYTIHEYNYVSASALDSILTKYCTTTYVAKYLSDNQYAKISDFSSYVTKAELSAEAFIKEPLVNAKLAPYALSSRFDDYYNKDETVHTFVTKTEAEGFLSTDDLDAALSGFVPVGTLEGYLTKEAADRLYELKDDVLEAGFVTTDQLQTTLQDYLVKASAADELSLSQYLTVSTADSSDGFVRKSYLSEISGEQGLVNFTSLASALGDYDTTEVARGYVDTQISSVTAAINAAKSETSATYATKAALQQLEDRVVIESGGTVLFAPEPDEAGVYPMNPRANNHIVLAGDMAQVKITPGDAAEGAARDFILTISFDRGTSMWGGTGFSIIPQTTGFFAAEPGILAVDTSEFDLDNQMVVFSFIEVATGKFLVSRKIVTALT